MHLRILILLCASCLFSRAFELPGNSSQCIVGISKGWDSSHVTLSYYEKSGGRWEKVGESWAGRLGRNGSIWGRGLHPVPQGARLKKEGDGRSPAGVFDLGGVWGAAAGVKKHPQTFYHQVTTRDLWVEDGSSKFYNQFLTLDHEPRTEWEKAAQMKQNDYPQSLKMFIGHNSPPNAVPYGGSSIFFHIWRRGGKAATAGCTTMVEGKLRMLIAEVDPNRRPLYVLLPKAEYTRLKPIWKLP